MNRLLYAILFMAIFVAVPTLHAADPSADDLRKAAQNPMADLLSVPFQNNTNFGYGPLEETQNITNIQPVIPFDLSENWLLISRTIAPLISQPGFYDGQDREFGLGYINQSLFLDQVNREKLSGASVRFFCFLLLFDVKLDSCTYQEAS